MLFLQRGWKYWECRSTKCLLGSSICERHSPVQVMECLFILFSGEWGRSGKQLCGFRWKIVQVVADSAYSLLSSEMTMVRKCWIWEQVVDGTRLAGEQENRNPIWPLPNLFANVYIYICSWIVASSSVSCHRGALWHHSASIYCIFSTFGYSPLFQLCIKNLNLLALSRNDRVGFLVCFFFWRQPSV